MKFLSTKGVTRMKKSNWLCGIAYVVAGIIFLLIGIFTDTKLDSLMFGFAGAGIIPGMVMIYKYFYWNSPNNVERYKEKLEAENIELHDELKDKVRGMTARYVYAFGLCVISASIVVFAILDMLEILENGKIFVFYLCAYMMFQIISGHIIFKHIFKKYK